MIDTMNMKCFGSCLCGQVKYEIDGTFDNFYLCHCKFCQKDTGSANAANLFSVNAHLTWISGSEKITIYKLPSTRHIKCFCSDCGSALPSLQMEGKLLVVPAGSVDSELMLKPDAHIFFSSRSSWEDGYEYINKFEKLPK